MCITIVFILINNIKDITVKQININNISSSVLNIRIDKETKEAFKEVAKLKGETLSSLGLKAINKMLEEEFDYQLTELVLKNRKSTEENYPIQKLFDEYEI